jgi:ectoine hydroxylase-related dioxygenase (phytanoyl-CoA dioxygenase family)
MLLPTAPSRPITQAEIDTFWRDGVVCLRNVVPLEWLNAISSPIDTALAEKALNLTNLEEESQATGGSGAVKRRPHGPHRGRFLVISDLWRQDETFKSFATRSPVPGIVGRLLNSSKVNLYDDAVFVKEPCSDERTAFHQDLSYFCAEGAQMCTTWIALDNVTKDTGALQFVQGSHLWKKTFKPNQFTNNAPQDNTEGVAVPDYSEDDQGQTILSFDLKPGDMTVHHTRTIHGAGSNNSRTVRRRGISLRYCGDDAVYRFRHGGIRKPHHDQVSEGTPLDHEGCPVVWRAA